jgi:hypothetical protein
MIFILIAILLVNLYTAWKITFYMEQHWLELGKVRVVLELILKGKGK